MTKISGDGDMERSHLRQWISEQVATGKNTPKGILFGERSACSRYSVSGSANGKATRGMETLKTIEF